MSDHESELAETELTPGSAGESANESARGRRRRNRSIAAESSVNMDELRELIQLIRENDFTELSSSAKGFECVLAAGPNPVRSARALLIRLQREPERGRAVARLSKLKPRPQRRHPIREPKPKLKPLKIRTFT